MASILEGGLLILLPQQPLNERRLRHPVPVYKRHCSGRTRLLQRRTRRLPNLSAWTISTKRSRSFWPAHLLLTDSDEDGVNLETHRIVWLPVALVSLVCSSLNLLLRIQSSLLCPPCGKAHSTGGLS